MPLPQAMSGVLVLSGSKKCYVTELQQLVGVLTTVPVIANR